MALEMLRNSPFWPSLNEFLDRYELHNDQKPTEERIKTASTFSSFNFFFDEVWIGLGWIPLSLSLALSSPIQYNPVHSNLI